MDPPSSFKTMVLLDGNNTGDQRINVTAQEARQWIPYDYDYYLMRVVNDASKNEYIWMPNVAIDNSRYTSFSVRLSTVGITERGLFRYYVYGQTSPTNTDPNDSSVVGLLDQGVMKIIGEPASTFPTLDVPDEVIYYE